MSDFRFFPCFFRSRALADLDFFGGWSGSWYLSNIKENNELE